MKRRVPVVFLAVLCLCFALVQPALAKHPPHGKPGKSACSAPRQDGSAKHPYLICTPDDLALLREHPDAHFELRADLDMSGLLWETPVDAFSGHLDGKGRTIFNLKGYIGLFRTIEAGGTVKRLRLANADIYSYSIGGLLAGTNRGTVEQVDVSGTISGRQVIVTKSAGFGQLIATR